MANARNAAAEPKRRRGRPTSLSAAVTKAICENLKLAMPLKYAAEAEGISEVTVHSWIERGNAGEEPYAAFSEAVTRARAQAPKTLTKKALAGGKGSHAAVWFLERRYRQDYGPIQKVELSGPDGSSVDLNIDAVSDATARALLETALGREAQ